MDRRVCVAIQDRCTTPYRYIGKIRIAGDPRWGSGALIGDRHVLTAAHVVKEVSAGPVVFELPDGTWSNVVEGHMRKQIESLPPDGVSVEDDVAMLLLETPIGSGGRHLSYGSIDNTVYERHHGGFYATAFDSDRTCPGDLPLTRRGSVSPGFRSTSITIHASGFKWEAGASGGPIWIIYQGRPVVVGVMSKSLQTREGLRGVPYSQRLPNFTYHSVGARINEGYRSLISGYIRTHP